MTRTHERTNTPTDYQTAKPGLSESMAYGAYNIPVMEGDRYYSTPEISPDRSADSQAELQVRPDPPRDLVFLNASINEAFDFLHTDDYSPDSPPPHYSQGSPPGYSSQGSLPGYSPGPPRQADYRLDPRGALPTPAPSSHGMDNIAYSHNDSGSPPHDYRTTYFGGKEQSTSNMTLADAMKDLDRQEPQHAAPNGRARNNGNSRNPRENMYVVDPAHINYGFHSSEPYKPPTPTQDGVFVIGESGVSPVVRRQPHDVTDSRTTVALPIKKTSSSKKCNSRCWLPVLVIVLLLVVIGGVVAALYFTGVFGGQPTEYYGEVHFNETWTPDLLNPNSVGYKLYEKDFLKQTTIMLDANGFKGEHTLELRELRPGSIIFVIKLLLTKAAEAADLETFIYQGWIDLWNQGLTQWLVTQTYFNEGSSGALTSPKVPEITITPTTMVLQTVDAINVTTSTEVFPENTDYSEIQTETESETEYTSSGIDVSTMTTMPTVPFSIIPPKRTTPLPNVCIVMTEGICLKYGYGYTTLSHVQESTRQLEFQQFLQLADRGCYDYVEMFACAYYYPECDDGRDIMPCQAFCEELKTQCNYPILCDSFPADDSPAMCVHSPTSLPNITVPTFTNPCSNDQFLCGNNFCVATSTVCNSQDDCGDLSDELNCGHTPSALDCNFEGGTLCGYTQGIADHYDWVVHLGHTGSSGTGPSIDHTHRTATGHYAVAEASGQYYRDEARLISPTVQLSGAHCLRFYYHMYGHHVEEFRVYSVHSDGTESLIWPRSRDQGNVWKYGYVTLPIGTYKVAFDAIRGSGYLGDIAVDDITMREGECAPQRCGAGEFSCSNENCLMQNYVCNSINDCGDFSDERDCQCTANEFQCAFGMCIPLYQRCDGTYNCPDQSDELHCSNCTRGRHMCSDGTCIMAEWVCDRERDCPDGSDELGCATCGVGQSMCQDYGCVDISAICDGISNCLDGSDEVDCFRKRNGDNVVEIKRSGMWSPLCSDGVDADTRVSLCHKTGDRQPLSYAAVVVSAGQYVRYIGTAANTTFIQRFTTVNQCPGQTSLQLTCQAYECGVPAVNEIITPYVVNGRDASPKEWPWQVLMYYQASPICGGTLVSPRHVVTAAHCLRMQGMGIVQASDFRVSVGSNKRTQPDIHRDVVTVKKYVVHEQYEAHHWGYDIAVLTLERDVVYSEYIRPACLADEDNYFSGSSLCYTTGFGYTDYYNRTLPDTLQEAKMKLWSQEKCRYGHPYALDSMMCAGYDSGYIANCPGDSGGPLVCLDPYGHWRLTGVFSFMAKGCDTPMIPPVFTRVQHYTAWLQSAMDCVLTCNNGGCIWDDTDMCNGVNDCGDWTDEINTCSSAVTCNFDTPYACGYTRSNEHSSTSTWSHITGAVSTPNLGPITDFSNGNNDGSYMFSTVDQSLLVSPVYSISTTHCYRFRYMLRAANQGRMEVFTAPVGNATAFPPDYNFGGRTTKVSLSYSTGEIWTVQEFDLTPGQGVVGFRALSATAGSGVSVAVDHAQLLTGSCGTQFCTGNEFACADNGECIPGAEQCNFHARCFDVSDEANCIVRGQYTCDLENYLACGWEQETYDQQDWSILASHRSNNNAPIFDHTSPIDYGGHMLYLDTSLGTTAQSAEIFLHVVATGASANCLHFFYSMVSNGSLTVSFETTAMSIAFARVRNNNHQWQHAQVPLPPSVRRILVSGQLGAEPPSAQYSYIALDDLSITTGSCASPECRPNQFRCGSGECKDMFSVCDGHKDCTDGSDETPQQCVCTDSSFRCNDGTCLQGHVRCNGMNNCPSGIDEQDCQGSSCRANEFRCNDGICKGIQVWCDGFIDCADRSDEVANCQCLPEQFRCSNGLCIMGIHYCDQRLDCADASDEPAGCGCDTRWHFQCQSGACIAKELRCDMRQDCPGGDDEIGCACNGLNEFQCPGGLCITNDKYCNGFVDCPGAEDEPVNCSCRADQFQCASGGCIPDYSRCDGHYMCPDHSDESNCVCDPTVERQCLSGKCIAPQYWCDGVLDCDDNSDESNCASSPCTANQFKCSNGKCLDSHYQCDGQDQCGDMSDELGCPCRVGEFRCGDGTCIQDAWKCDGERNCQDGLDEDGCATCSSGELQCPTDKSCVSFSFKCNGINDCADGYDEINCVESDITTNYVIVVSSSGLPGPICWQNWQEQWSNQLCKLHTNAGSALYTSYTVPAAGTYTVFRNVRNEFVTNAMFNLSMLDYSNSCPNNRVLKVECSSAGCGKRSHVSASGISPYLIGGDFAAAGDYPWNVAIMYLGRFHCGATLLSSNWLVTAAHCAYRLGQSLVNVPQYLTVRLGDNNLVGNASGLQLRQVERIILHPNYTVGSDSFRHNDIAMVKLQQPVTITDYVHTTCLPDETAYPISRSSICYTAGWGLTSVDASTAAVRLRDARMQLWRSNDCQSPSAWGNSLNPSTQLCAGYTNGYISSCQGDSGSALVCRVYPEQWILVGVTSQGPDKCGQYTQNTARPTVYTSVDSYQSWITQTMMVNK